MSQCMDGGFFFFFFKGLYLSRQAMVFCTNQISVDQQEKKSQQIKTVNFSSHKTFFCLPMEKEEVGKITCEKEKNIKKKKGTCFSCLKILIRNSIPNVCGVKVF